MSSDLTDDHENGEPHCHAPCPFCTEWRSGAIFAVDAEFVPIEAQIEQAKHMHAAHRDRFHDDEISMFDDASDEQMEHLLHEANKVVFGADLIPFASRRAEAN